MGFSIRNAMASGAAGVADVAGTYAKTEIAKSATLDIEKARAEIQAERDARLHEQAKSMQTDVIQPFLRSEREAGQEFQRGENKENRQHQTNLQKAGFDHAEIMQLNNQDFQASENDKSRMVQLAGQSIQLRQVEVLERGAALDQRIKAVQAENAETLAKLQDDYKVETDPKKKEALRDDIAVLSGKQDKFMPLPLKDEMGNITGYQIFDTHRGVIMEPGRGGPAAGGVAKPTTQKEMDDLPPGARYINPADGKEYIKRAPKAEPQKTSAAPASGGMISGERRVISGGSGYQPVGAEEYAARNGGGIDEIRSIETALQNAVTPEQKSALSLQLQEAMRKAGKLGE